MFHQSYNCESRETVFALSLIMKLGFPSIPFMDRMAIVFLAAAVLAVVVSRLQPAAREINHIKTSDVS